MPSIDDLFKGRHFDREVIILCVYWYLRFKLSLRDLVNIPTLELYRNLGDGVKKAA